MGIQKKKIAGIRLKTTDKTRKKPGFSAKSSVILQMYVEVNEYIQTVYRRDCVKIHKYWGI